MVNNGVPSTGVIVVSIFSVYDKKALTYGAPFCFIHRAEALRAIQDDMCRANSHHTHHTYKT